MQIYLLRPLLLYIFIHLQPIVERKLSDEKREDTCYIVAHLGFAQK